MKHIKKFEETSLSPIGVSVPAYYNIGDYVILRNNYYTDFKRRRAKITNKDDEGYYVLALSDNNNKVYNDMWCDVSMILRYMTPEEIEDFEQDVNLIKYNM